ncbi:ABC transporter substrate-binding protein [Cryobacterium sp. Hb1]|uniref:ABC transporter substrate-binding protein n=1 Tax=Cryobacterium sp. Hb1 TaxID=1259147 RepID=UPI00141BA0CE|nr:ABC transporter substrate-binding protein [Cryobacterium sp. Hb1]
MAILAGCAPASTTNSAAPAELGDPVQGGSATLATQGAPVNMDPAEAQLYASIQVYQNIFSTLINVDENFEFVSNLAESWQQDDDLTWSFTLVEGVKFHNGETLTAGDVAFSIERMRTAAQGVFVSVFESVEVIDDLNFKIHLSAPYGPMEATLASVVGIVNQKAVESSDPKEKPVGTGPYKLTKWVKGSTVTLTRFDDYFKSEKPYLDEVVFEAVPDDSVRLAGLQTGQFDWIQTVPAQQIPELVKSSKFGHTDAGAYLPYLLILNTTSGPFTSLEARQGLNWLIDREQIVDLAFSGAAVEASEAVSNDHPFYSGVDIYEGAPDIDKGQALFDEAGVVGEPIVILVDQADSAYALIAQVIQSELAEVGMTATIETVASSEYFGRMVSKDFDIAMTYFTASLDPALTYNLLGQSESGFNFTGYQSSELDAALEEFTTSTDQDARKAFYPDLVEAFQEESPFIFVANRETQYFTSSTLGGASSVPTLEVRAEDLWQAAAE